MLQCPHSSLVNSGARLGMDECGIYQVDTTYFANYHREAAAGPERGNKLNKNGV